MSQTQDYLNEIKIICNEIRDIKNHSHLSRNRQSTRMSLRYSKITRKNAKGKTYKRNNIISTVDHKDSTERKDMSDLHDRGDALTEYKIHSDLRSTEGKNNTHHTCEALPTHSLSSLILGSPSTPNIAPVVQPMWTGSPPSPSPSSSTADNADLVETVSHPSSSSESDEQDSRGGDGGVTGRGTG